MQGRPPTVPGSGLQVVPGLGLNDLLVFRLPNLLRLRINYLLRLKPDDPLGIEDIVLLICRRLALLIHALLGF